MKGEYLLKQGDTINMETIFKRNLAHIKNSELDEATAEKLASELTEEMLKIFPEGVGMKIDRKGNK